MGVAVYAAVAVFFVYFQYVIFFTPFGLHRSLQEKIGIALCFAFLFPGVCYYLYCFSQIFIVELRQKFIAWQVTLNGDEFGLRGYYFKRDTFRNSDVECIEPYYADKHWFGKEMGTLLTRTRWSNLNYKVQLKDGRIFYLPGEMEQVEELKALLSGMAVTNAAMH